ncbi:MAG: hypothetical protein WAZ77_09255 [Candidatus Nitrosopolaris sp.]
MPSIAQSRIVYDRATKHIDHTRTRGDNNNYLVRQNEETLQSLGIFNLIIHGKQITSRITSDCPESREPMA